jgi:DNA-directed RNA polymerase specialized sigma24 family protein
MEAKYEQEITELWRKAVDGDLSVDCDGLTVPDHLIEAILPACRAAAMRFVKKQEARKLNRELAEELASVAMLAVVEKIKQSQSSLANVENPAAFLETIFNLTFSNFMDDQSSIASGRTVRARRQPPQLSIDVADRSKIERYYRELQSGIWLTEERILELIPAIVANVVAGLRKPLYLVEPVCDRMIEMIRGLSRPHLGKRSAVVFLAAKARNMLLDDTPLLLSGLGENDTPLWSHHNHLERSHINEATQAVDLWDDLLACCHNDFERSVAVHSADYSSTEQIAKLLGKSENTVRRARHAIEGTAVSNLNRNRRAGFSRRKLRWAFGSRGTRGGGC